MRQVKSTLTGLIAKTIMCRSCVSFMRHKNNNSPQKTQRTRKTHWHTLRPGEIYIVFSLAEAQSAQRVIGVDK